MKIDKKTNTVIIPIEAALNLPKPQSNTARSPYTAESFWNRQREVCLTKYA